MPPEDDEPEPEVVVPLPVDRWRRLTRRPKAPTAYDPLRGSCLDGGEIVR